MLELTLPPHRTPTIQPYARANAQAVGPPISGEVVDGRSTLYGFNVDDLPDGDYVVDIANPLGRFVLRKSLVSYLMAEEWWELDFVTDPSRDPGKVLVNQDYGGTDALVYALEDMPVANAIVELFLFSDYAAGKHNGNYRLNNTRQTVDGTWAMPFYLDPQAYVLRYYRTGVAGPDAWKLIVSFNPEEIVITPLDVCGSGATLGIHREVPEVPVVPPPPPENTVVIDHNYGGPNNLVYWLSGRPVDGAVIQLYLADDYNSGHRLPVNIVAQTEQRADGSWVRPLSLLPGRYVMHCFKRGVAGPNAFSLVVE